MYMDSYVTGSEKLSILSKHTYGAICVLAFLVKKCQSPVFDIFMSKNRFTNCHRHLWRANTIINYYPCTRGKVVSSVIVIIIIMNKKSPYLEIQATRQLISTTKFNEKLASVCFKWSQNCLTERIALTYWISSICFPISIYLVCILC